MTEQRIVRNPILFVCVLLHHSNNLNIAGTDDATRGIFWLERERKKNKPMLVILIFIHMQHYHHYYYYIESYYFDIIIIIL